MDYVLSFEDDEDVAFHIGSALQSFSFDRAASARELFAALSRRWLAISTPVLDAFDNLINTMPGEEPAFQSLFRIRTQTSDSPVDRSKSVQFVLGEKSTD